MTYFSPKKYSKSHIPETFDKHVNYRFAARARIIPTVLFSLGILIIITQVIIPMYFFTVSDNISSPIAGSVLGVATGFSAFEFAELGDADTTYTTGNVPSNFYLTIPKLGISNARVKTNSADMSPEGFVGHYRGSALPGENGTAFLYGHSVLQVFYNPNNYKTIFSTLNKLDPEDTYTVSYNNKTYTYKVEEVVILDTEDVQPLAPIKPTYLNDSTMVLMTCWPPGLKTKRLQVNSVLVE